MSRATLITAAIAQFGPKIALTDAADIAPWLTDWRGRWTGASAAILQPEATEAGGGAGRAGREAQCRARPAGRQHVDGRRRDPARRWLGADPLAAADESYSHH